MKLRGIDFGYALNAAGARGFFGEGYWFHKFWTPWGLSYYGSTFVAKTTSLEHAAGHLPMCKDGITPKEWFPRCIKVKMRHGAVLNAVGVSGPGAQVLLDLGYWQKRIAPFFLSFMAVSDSADSRLGELRKFVAILKKALLNFNANVALEINFSCPNVGWHFNGLLAEANAALTIAGGLGIPLVPKFNALLPENVAWAISKHDRCDAICISNTIPWGKLPHLIPWRTIFGSDQSPLARFGGGGYSGHEILQFVCDWIGEARSMGITKPIIGCGGIRDCFDADRMIDAGASAIQLGSVSIVRPWRVQDIIHHINSRFTIKKSAQMALQPSFAS